MNNQKLLESIVTDEQRQVVLHKLDTLIVDLFRLSPESKEFNLEKYLQDHAGIEFTQLIQNLAEDNKIDPRDLQQIKNLLSTLRQNLAQLKIFKIILAIDPDKDFALKLSNWVHEHINKDVIVEIEVNPIILGGSIIIFDGKYFNNSLSNIINQSISQHIQTDQKTMENGHLSSNKFSDLQQILGDKFSNSK